MCGADGTAANLQEVLSEEHMVKGVENPDCSLFKVNHHWPLHTEDQRPRFSGYEKASFQMNIKPGWVTEMVLWIKALAAKADMLSSTSRSYRTHSLMSFNLLM